MKRQALLLLCTLSLAPACVLNLEVLDGVGDDVDDTDDTDDTETGSETADTDTTDAESSTSSTDESSSSTDAESSSTDAGSSSTDAGSSSTDAESSSTDAESSSSTTDPDADWGTSDAPPDCAEAQSQYEAIVAKTDCMVDTDCKIISGHCSVGLGGCYYAVNTSVDEAYLDTLAQVWSDGGCTQGVCDCAAPPASAICDAGICVGVD